MLSERSWFVVSAVWGMVVVGLMISEMVVCDKVSCGKLEGE